MINILMAVYNGDKFLREQIESVINQGYKEWQLYICDDGSSDSSLNIAKGYEKKHPGKIVVSVNGATMRSACGNFMGMLVNSEAEYVMFCDQDDVWREDKIEVTFEKMREIEKRHPGMPVLVHTDLEIVDRDLNITAESFMKYQGLKPKYKSINRLLCQNNVTGCTMMMNRALADIVKNAPVDGMLMHDWWAGLAAAAFGAIGFVDKPTVMYRQHGGNQLGAVNNRSVRGAVRVIKSSGETKRRIFVTYEQAAKFYEYYKDILNADSREILKKYIDIPKNGKISRMIRLIKYGFLKQNFLSAAGQLIFC